MKLHGELSTSIPRVDTGDHVLNIDVTLLLTFLESTGGFLCHNQGTKAL